jgi:hypothetical protein
MRITKSELRRIIEEEILKEMYQPVGDRDAMMKVKEIAEEALMNKSFGMPQNNLAEQYFEKIASILKSTTGTSRLPGEKYDTSMGFGSAKDS